MRLKRPKQRGWTEQQIDRMTQDQKDGLRMEHLSGYLSTVMATEKPKTFDQVNEIVLKDLTTAYELLGKTVEALKVAQGEDPQG